VNLQEALISQTLAQESFVSPANEANMI